MREFGDERGVAGCGQVAVMVCCVMRLRAARMLCSRLLLKQRDKSASVLYHTFI